MDLINTSPPAIEIHHIITEDKTLSKADCAKLVKDALKKNPLKNPFPIRFNDAYASLADEATNTWIENFYLIDNPECLQKFTKARFIHLTSGAYPNCYLDQLIPIAQWIAFLYLNDDDVEKRDLRSLIEFNKKNMQILKNESQPIKDDRPITHALYDLARRIEAKTTSNWFERFSQTVEGHFQSIIWEAEKREAGIEIPDYEEYLIMRMDTSAVYTVFPLIELAEQIDLPQVIIDQYLKEFNRLGNRIISWSNDIKSCPKEFAEKFKNNLVFVIYRHLNCSINEAITHAIILHNQDVESFEKLKGELYAKLESDPQLKPYSENIRKYVEGIRFWLGSHYDFAFKSDRYN